VEAVVQAIVVHPGTADIPRPLLVAAARQILEEERAMLRRSADSGGPAASLDALVERAASRARRIAAPSLRRVLNATGIVLHTNLGRSPLSEPARRALDDVARGYSNLEYDLATGRRGERGLGVERRLVQLTGAEAALVVNNGAAAILLALSALAQGRHVLVSRGELVEIGGSFRMPDVMEKSGARMVEVGTTNRTGLSDYEKALARHGKDVAAILRVHPSNFRIEGFTRRPALADLATLAHRKRIPLIEDLGSGALVDLGRLGLEAEPTVTESLKAGCDLVTFSGDKLLGSTQAGFVLGRKSLVQRMRRDPLARALRVDKLTLAACEATLLAYCDPARAAREIPALRMLGTSETELETRARSLADAIRLRVPALQVNVERGDGEVGGGALPLLRLPSRVVALGHPRLSADVLDQMLRGAEPPVVGYIRAGKVRLDVRTLTDDEVHEAAETLGRITWPGVQG
jgi:L-seryl-tRNA(Ser) seleniumtransferase